MTHAPRWTVDGRTWPNRDSSRFVEVGRLRWHVQIMGPEDAPAVLLLHGTGAATHSWRDLAPLLAARFRVVALDLPGHGFTSGGSVGGLAMPAMARAVSELLSTLAIEPTLIVGHSAGAAVAIRMVIDGHAKPAAIVGLSAALLPFPGLAAKLFPSLARLLFVNPLAPHLFARLGRIPGETGRFLARSTGSRIEGDGIDCYQALFATSGHCAGAITMMADWDLPALKRELPRLAVPLLLIHGEADAAIPLPNAREAAAMVGNARLVALPGLGHLAHEEKPSDIVVLITDFAAEVSR